MTEIYFNLSQPNYADIHCNSIKYFELFDNFYNEYLVKFAPLKQFVIHYGRMMLQVQVA
jgi:hypothetical protein